MIISQSGAIENQKASLIKKIWPVLQLFPIELVTLLVHKLHILKSHKQFEASQGKMGVIHLTSVHFTKDSFNKKSFHN